MAKQKPTINLRDLQHLHIEGRDFKVHSLKNSIEFSPESYLRKSQVQRLIDEGWVVNIMPAVD